MDSDRLSGDPYDLVKPTLVAISPPDESLGTGIIIRFAVRASVLYGLSHNSATQEISRPTSWDHQIESLRLKRWTRQDLVQVNLNLHTIQDELSLVRNRRGAHSDRAYLDDTPQSLAPFYYFYLDVFMIHVGALLVDQIVRVADDRTILDKIFPHRDNPKPWLRYGAPAQGVIRVEPERFDFREGKGYRLSTNPYLRKPGCPLSHPVVCRSTRAPQGQNTDVSARSHFR